MGVGGKSEFMTLINYELALSVWWPHANMKIFKMICKCRIDIFNSHFALQFVGPDLLSCSAATRLESTIGECDGIFGVMGYY